MSYGLMLISKTAASPYPFARLDLFLFGAALGTESTVRGYAKTQMGEALGIRMALDLIWLVDQQSAREPFSYRPFETMARLARSEE